MSIHSFLTNCQEGKEEEVRRSLNRGEVGVNSSDESGHTATQVAAANDQSNILRLLIEFKADINQTNHIGWSPLHQACLHGHVDLARLLLDKGADLYARTKYGASVLTLAAASGHLSTVRLLLEAGLKPDDLGSGEYKICPVASMVATLYSHQSILQLLLNRGAKPDAILTPSRWTPLMFAAADGHKLNCQLLLDRSADPNKVNLLGLTPLDIALNSGLNGDVCNYLKERTETNLSHDDVNHVEESRLIIAAREGDEERILELLETGDISIDIEDVEGATPLILASIGGFTSIVRILIDHGSDVNKQDRINKWTALMQATFFNHKQIAQLLLQSKADPSLTGANGCTAFDLATLVDDQDGELVKLLAEYTAANQPLDKFSLHKASKPRIAFDRSRSSINLNDLRAQSGLKGFWNKMYKSFQNMTGTSLNPSDISTNNQLQVVDGNGLGMKALIPPVPVFTPGFTTNTSLNNMTMGGTLTARHNDMSPFRPHMHDTSLSSSKFGMPIGNTDLKHPYPDSKVLLTLHHTNHQSSRKKSGIKTSRSRYSSTGDPSSGKEANTSVTNVKRTKSGVGERNSRSRSRRRTKNRVEPNIMSPEMNLESVLKLLKLSHLLPKFVAQEVDLSILLEDIQEPDLIEIGVQDQQDRSKILEFVKKFKKNR